MNKNNQQGFNPSVKESFNIAYGLMSVIAMSFIPFFRYGQGREGFGIRALLALILMLSIGSLGYAPEMFVFAAIWLLFVAFRRLQTLRLLKKGYVIHSRSWGMTTCRVRLPGMTKEQTGHSLEVICCVAAALWLGQTYPVLGCFLVAGAVSLVFVGAVHEEADRRKIQAMADSRLEQQWLADRVRGQGW